MVWSYQETEPIFFSFFCLLLEVVIYVFLFSDIYKFEY